MNARTEGALPVQALDPQELHNALDHIARTAAASRTATRRVRWIQCRAEGALRGHQYRPGDYDLPKDATESAEKFKRKAAHLRRMNAELLQALMSLRHHIVFNARGELTEEEFTAMLFDADAAIERTTGSDAT